MLTKILPLFLFPLGAAILLGATVLLLEFGDRCRLRRVLLALMLFVLWISATPFFANWLYWRVALPALPVGEEMGAHNDAVILLAGTPSARIVHALRLYRAGKAPRIVITGGNLPWQNRRVSEAQRVSNRLVDLGAPPSALVLETKSRNTRENALNTAAIFADRDWREGLLVTSSIHMPRALAAFSTVGIEVTAAPTDFPGPPVYGNILHLLPDAEALARTTAAIRELIGLWFYRLRGWA